METLETIVSFAKQRGFIFQSSEIYGGLSSCYDYGPLGMMLKDNVKKAWWKWSILYVNRKYTILLHIWIVCKKMNKLMREIVTILNTCSSQSNLHKNYKIKYEMMFTIIHQNLNKIKRKCFSFLILKIMKVQKQGKSDHNKPNKKSHLFMISWQAK